MLGGGAEEFGDEIGAFDNRGVGGRPDAEILEPAPKGGERTRGLSEVFPTADPEELPPDALQQHLPSYVIAVSIEGMPAFAVALDGEAVGIAVDHEVDAVLADANLGAETIAPVDDLPRHETLEVVAFGILEDLIDFPPGAVPVVAGGEVSQEASAHVLWVEGGRVDRVHDPQLIAGAADRHVEPLLVGSPVENRGRISISGPRPEREHDVPVVALKVVGVAGNELTSVELLRRDELAHTFVDGVRLGLAEEGDDANGDILVGRMLAAGRDEGGDLLGLHLVRVCPFRPEPRHPMKDDRRAQLGDAPPCHRPWPGSSAPHGGTPR